jgi:hypothetical protein
LWLALLLGLAAARPGGAQSLTNQHVSSAGVQGNGWAANDDPSLSDDGRYVAFASYANNLFRTTPTAMGTSSSTTT